MFGKISDRGRKWVAEGIALGYPENGPGASVGDLAQPELLL